MQLSRLFVLGPDVVSSGTLKLELVLTVTVALFDLRLMRVLFLFYLAVFLFVRGQCKIMGHIIYITAMKHLDMHGI
jgi:hypothetical protein